MAELRMNLAALQQRDPYITDIVDTATQVALYSFGKKTEWEKTEIEGSLFVYTRSAVPFKGFMILNRLGLNNLIEPLTKEHEFHPQEPFLLYRNSNSIFGIWFYNKEECSRIGQLLNRLVNDITEIVPKSGRQLTSGGESMNHTSKQKGVDILQLLSRAQEEYDTSRSSDPKPIGNNSHAASHKSPNIVKPTPVRAPSVDSSQLGAAPSIDLDTLFRNASLKHKDQASVPIIDLSSSLRSQSILPNIDGHPSLQKLKSIPGTTLEEIEKLHRGQVSSNQQPAASVNVQPQSHNTVPSSLDAELKRHLNIASSANDTAAVTTSKHNPSVLSRQLSATGIPSQPVTVQQTSCKVVAVRSASLPQDVLLSPMAFLSSQPPRDDTPQMINIPGQMLGAQASAQSASGDFAGVNPLTKDQMQQALVYLIKNDGNFMTMLHEAYVKSLTEFTSKKS